MQNNEICRRGDLDNFVCSLSYVESWLKGIFRFKFSEAILSHGAQMLVLH